MPATVKRANSPLEKELRALLKSADHTQALVYRTILTEIKIMRLEVLPP